MDTDTPGDWTALHAAAWARGWSIGAASPSYRAGWAYAALRLEGTTMTARRSFATADELRHWIAGGCADMGDAPTAVLKSPFPYFGGKSRVTSLIWERFGHVANYVDPFFGSGAVLLGCPWPGHTETVNDMDGLLANFWRALQAEPDAVAAHCDWPVSELDLHARHRWLVNQRADVERLLDDPAYYDVQIAGWWVWGISQWIGSGWCPTDGTPARKRPHMGGVNTNADGSPGAGGGGKGVHRSSLTPPPAPDNSTLWQQRPDLSSAGRGLAAPRLAQQLPSVGGGARGGHRERHHPASSPASVTDVGELARKLPHVGDAGRGLHRASEAHALRDYLRALSARLRRVRVTCGDFERVLGPSVTWRHGVTAVLLDPPYDIGERARVYAVESDAAHRARAWAVANGDNPLLRIAYCGYDTGEAWPDGWQVVRWKTAGGYGGQGTGRGRANAHRERVWFSPHCINETPLERLLREQEAA